MARFDIFRSINDCAIYDHDKIASFKTEEEAVSFCEEHNWEIKDENDIWYDLLISDSLED